MGQFLIRRVGEGLWMGERQLMPEETRESLEQYLLLTGSTLRDLAFENADVRAEFEARFGLI
ncbi:MAG: hypothetical protein M3P23_09535 [Actinomycetota bacterium]|nr:hypothetical protein [Actinomycetota bacterium]